VPSAIRIVRDKPYAERYNPAKGRPPLVSSTEWIAIRSFVVAAAEPLNHLSNASVCRYLRALIGLALYYKARGQDLTVSFLFRTDVLQAYAKAAKIDRAEVGCLSRLAKEHGLALSAVLPSGSPLPAYAMPYSDDEVDALLRAAENLGTENLGTENRRLTASAVLLLGAGCGIVRQGAANITATSVHFHGDMLFVSVDGRCAKFRDTFITPLLELTEARPTGRLRGTMKPDNVIEKVRTWLCGMPGVPTLFINQLRATYICAHLSDGVGLVDLMAWTGLQSAESVDGYLGNVHTARSCPRVVEADK